MIEFHHDRKNRAAKFHKACEQMMKALLFTEMAKIDAIDQAAKDETKGDEGGEIVGGYMVSEHTTTQPASFHLMNPRVWTRGLA